MGHDQVLSTELDSLQLAGVAGVLSREQIRARTLADPPLISQWTDLDAQLQPNGFDLTLAEIARYEDGGILAVDNSDRRLPALTPLPFDDAGFLDLQPGPYHIAFNETVCLPKDLMALGRARSSLNRSGVTIHTAVWDAGYEGRSTALLVVFNPAGFRVQHRARVLQLVFFGLARSVEHGYAGAYQGENLAHRPRSAENRGV